MQGSRIRKEKAVDSKYPDTCGRNVDVAFVPQWDILACVLCFNFRSRDGSPETCLFSSNFSLSTCICLRNL